MTADPVRPLIRSRQRAAVAAWQGQAGPLAVIAPHWTQFEAVTGRPRRRHPTRAGPGDLRRPAPGTSKPRSGRSRAGPGLDPDDSARRHGSRCPRGRPTTACRRCTAIRLRVAPRKPADLHLVGASSGSSSDRREVALGEGHGRSHGATEEEAAGERLARTLRVLYRSFCDRVADLRRRRKST